MFHLYEVPARGYNGRNAWGVGGEVDKDLRKRRVDVVSLVNVGVDGSKWVSLRQCERDAESRAMEMLQQIVSFPRMRAERKEEEDRLAIGVAD